MAKKGKLNTKQLNIINNALKHMEMHEIEEYLNDWDESTMIVCEPYPNMHTIVNWHLNHDEIDIYTMKKVATIQYGDELFETILDACLVIEDGWK